MIALPSLFRERVLPPQGNLRFQDLQGQGAEQIVTSVIVIVYNLQPHHQGKDHKNQAGSVSLHR